jgi:hypothetical protein
MLNGAEDRAYPWDGAVWPHLLIASVMFKSMHFFCGYRTSAGKIMDGLETERITSLAFWDDPLAPCR